MAEYSLGNAHGRIIIDADTSGIDQAQRGLTGLSGTAQSTGDKLSGVGTKMGIAGAAVAGGLGLAIKTAANFEQGLSQIQAVSGATTSEMAKLHDKALQIGKTTSFGATEAASAMEELVKAGISVNDVLGGAADATVALAAAGGVDMPTAATIASNAMNQFGLAAGDMVGTVDLIAGAANASAIDVTDFGMSMGQVGAVANLAGLDFNDTAVAIAEMGNAGIKGSDAGTSLKSMLMNLQPTTKKAANEMKDLGIITEDGSNRFYDAQGNLKSLGEIQGILQESTNGLSEAQKTQALQTIFGSDAIRAAAIMADNGAAGFTKMNDAMLKTSAADVAKARMDNFKGSLENMKGSVETAAILVGEQFLPALKGLADFVGSLFDKFNNLSPAVQNLIVGFIAAIGTTLLVGAAMLKMVKVIESVKLALAALKLAAMANPFTAIVMGIIMLVTLLATLYATSETFRNIVSGAFTAVSNAFQTMWQFMMDHSTIFGIIGGLIATLLLPTLVTLGGAALTAAASFVAAGLSMIASWVAQAAAAVLNAAVIAAQWVVAQAKAVISAAVQVAQGLLVIGSWIAMAVTAGAQALLIAGAWLLSNGVGAATALASLAVAVVTTVAGWIAMAAGAIAGAASVALAWFIALGPIGWAIAALIAVVAFVIIFWDDIKGWFSKGAQAVSDLMQKAWDWVKEKWEGIKSAFEDAKAKLTTTLEALKTAITNKFNEVMNFLGGIPGKIIGVFAAAGSWLVNAGSNVVSGLWNGFNAMWGGFWGAITGIAGKVIGAVAGAGQWLWSAGYNMIVGFINGIGAMAGRAVQAAVNVVKNAVGAVTSFLHIGSPSKLLMEIGEWTSEGLAIGIKDETKQAIAAAQNLAASVTGSLGMLPDGPGAYWDASSLGVGNVPASPEVEAHAASQGDTATTNITTIINNPVAEKSSDSEARRLRTLSALGAL